MKDPTSFVLELPAGVALRDPSNGRLVRDGQVLPRDAFWQRRLATGEVREREEGAAPAAEVSP